MTDTAKMSSYVSKDNIDLLNKLEYLCNTAQISQSVYSACKEEKIFSDIENFIWDVLNGNLGDKKLSEPTYYVGLEGNDFKPKNEQDLWSMRVYNCDELYTYAIADVLNNCKGTSRLDSIKATRTR